MKYKTNLVMKYYFKHINIVILGLLALASQSFGKIEVVETTNEYQVVSLVIKNKDNQIIKNLLIKGHVNQLLSDELLNIIVNKEDTKKFSYILVMTNKNDEEFSFSCFPLTKAEGENLRSIFELKIVKPQSVK